jgi:hypothetical protein
MPPINLDRLKGNLQVQFGTFPERERERERERESCMYSREHFLKYNIYIIKSTTGGFPNAVVN